MHRAQGGPREKASLSYNPDHRQKDRLAVGCGEGYQLISTLQECPSEKVFNFHLNMESLGVFPGKVFYDSEQQRVAKL